MTEEANFFEAPPADSDAPILLGPPAGGDDYAAFAAPPVEGGGEGFVGDVDATTPPAPEEGAPILLGDAPPPVYSEEAAPVTFEEVEEEEAEAPVKSAMTQWNEEWQVTLKERKDAENALKAEHVEQARKDMDDFSAQREIKREKKMAKNRADEQEKLEAIEADLENDNSWQRVCKLVELQHADDGGANVGRMRDVMIQLKNDTNLAAVCSS